MAADRRPRPTRTDWQSVILQLPDDWYKAYESQMQQEVPQEEAGLLSDAGHAFAAGINDLAAIPFWAAEELGIDRARHYKDYFLRSAEEKRQGYSPEMKEAQQKEFFTDEPDGTKGIGEAWTSPRKIMGTVAESMPGMMLGMGGSQAVAAGLLKAGFSKGLAWAVGSPVGEGGVAGAQNALGNHEAVRNMPEEMLAQAPEYLALLKETGDPTKARERLANAIALQTGSGGKSQLAYGPKAMPQAMPAPAPIPSPAQITNTQQAPRADTMAQAQALGIPAPDVMPAEVQPVAGPQIPQVPQMQQAVPFAQSAPVQVPQTMLMTALKPWRA